MAISLGDATLVFLGDQTNLDQAFESVPGKAQKAFGGAAKFVQTFNDELDATGENVAFAGERIMSLTEAFRTLGVQGPDRLKQKLDNAKTAFQTLVDAGVDAKGTLLDATIRVTEREIAYQQALGESTVVLEEQLAAQRAQRAELGGALTFQQRVTAALSEQATVVESLGAAWRTVQSAVLSLFTAGIFVHFLEETAHALDQLDDLAHASGISVGQLVQLRGAFRESGDDADRLSQQLSKVAKGLSEAETGGAKQRETFRALGVDFDAATGKAPPLMNALMQIGDHLSNTKAGTETLGLAYQALGKNSVELISFLSQGSAAIQEQMSHYQGLADATEKAIAAGAEFNRLQAQISANFQELMLPAFRALVVAFQYLAAYLTLEEAKLENYGRVVLLRFTVLGDAVEGVIEMLKSLVLFDFSGVADNFKAMVQHMKDDGAIAQADMNATAKAAAKKAQDFFAEVADQNKKNLGDQFVPPPDAGNKLIEATKSLAEARLAVEHQYAMISLDLAGATYSQLLAEQKKYEEEKYQIELKAEQQKLAKLQADPTTDPTAKREQLDKILTLEANHHAEELKELEKHIAAMKAVIKAAQQEGGGTLDLIKAPDSTKFATAYIDPITKKYHAAMDEIVSDTENATNRALQAFQELGVQAPLLLDSFGNLVTPLEKAQHAYDDLLQSGLATDTQLLEANIALAKQELEFEQQMGFETMETQQRLAKLQEELDKKTGKSLQTASQNWNSFFTLLLTKGLTAGQAVRAFGMNLAQGIGAAVAAAVSGQMSFGAAMQNMAKAAITALAQVATVEGLHQIGLGFAALANPFTADEAPGYFLAGAKLLAVAAIASIAGAMIPSAGGGAGGGGGSSAQAPPPNLPPSPVTTPQASGQEGGTATLVTGGTMRIVGASVGSSGAVAAARETLESGGNIAEPHMPTLVDAFRAAFGDTIATNIYIKGDVVDHGQLMRKQSQMVKKGLARSTATDALRVTRRS